jgi:flagellar biosynthesis/type III secretory pathway protein FliH
MSETEPNVAAEVVGLLRALPRVKITPENVTQHLIDRWYAEKGEYVAELRELRTEVEQLRTEREGRMAQAFASGWCDAIAAYRSPGWAEREEAWRRYREAVRADAETGAS